MNLSKSKATLFLLLIFLTTSISCKNETEKKIKGDTDKIKDIKGGCSGGSGWFGKVLWTRDFPQYLADDGNQSRKHPLSRINNCDGDIAVSLRSSVQIIDSEDGSIRESISAERPERPMCSGKNIIFGTQNGISSYNLKESDYNWVYKGSIGNYKVSDNKVYLMNYNNNSNYIEIIHTKNKKVIDTKQINTGSPKYIVLGNDIIFLLYNLTPLDKSSEQFKISAHNRRGVLLWTRTFNETAKTPPVYRNGDLFVKSTNQVSEVESGFEQQDLGDTYIRKFSSSGDLVWSTNVGGTVLRSGISVKENRVFVSINGVKILDRKSGNIIDKYTTDKLHSAIKPVATKNNVYVTNLGPDNYIAKINYRDSSIVTSQYERRVQEITRVGDKLVVKVNSSRLSSVCL